MTLRRRPSPPAGNRGAKRSNEDDTTTVTRRSDVTGIPAPLSAEEWAAIERDLFPTLPSEALARRTWAAQLLRRAPGPRPRYGTPAWHALPEGHPAKVAAVVAAAECWMREADDLEGRTRCESRQDWRLAKQREDAEWLADCEAHAAEVHRALAATAPPWWADQPIPPRPLEHIGRDYVRTLQNGGAA